MRLYEGHSFTRREIPDCRSYARGIIGTFGTPESARTNPPVERDLWVAIGRKFQFWTSGLGNAASD